MIFNQQNFKTMSKIEVKGNGNFVFQGQSGSEVTVSNGKVEITQNKATPKEILIEMIDFDLQGAFLKLDSINWGNRKGMYVDLKREFIDRPVGFSLSNLRSRLKILISYVDCSQVELSVNQQLHNIQGWEPELLQIIKDNDRKNTDAVNQATTLLQSFRDYYDAKRTRAFFDRSGEQLEEIQQQFEDFKKTLNKSENESVDKFIDLVAGHLSARVPDWLSIADAYRLCLGRGFRSQFIEVNLTATPNDNDAKLSAVKTIEDFLGTL